jgi:hypothetical protein
VPTGQEGSESNLQCALCSPRSNPLAPSEERIRLLVQLSRSSNTAGFPGSQVSCARAAGALGHGTPIGWMLEGWSSLPLWPLDAMLKSQAVTKATAAAKQKLVVGAASTLLLAASPWRARWRGFLFPPLAADAQAQAFKACLPACVRRGIPPASDPAEGLMDRGHEAIAIMDWHCH